VTNPELIPAKLAYLSPLAAAAAASRTRAGPGSCRRTASSAGARRRRTPGAGARRRTRGAGTRTRLSRSASFAVEPVNVGSPFLAATQAAAIAVNVMVHREMASADAMRVHRHAVNPTMHASTVKTRCMKSPMETTTATMETTTTTATMEPTAAATVGQGRSAQRNGDHADHRNKCNWPHDVSSQILRTEENAQQTVTVPLTVQVGLVSVAPKGSMLVTAI
jgi:hypothetical protein